MTGTWRVEEAEAHLLSLELFGMRFGLDRMRRLLTVLGSPQERFAAIHVVGTNGKSSTVRMCAALLEAHGVRTGAFVSPHLISFAERIRIADADLDGDAFGATVQRAATAAAKVNRTLEPGDRVTQFELVAAAAFAEFARRGVEVAVVEAGLGGRHDATNVLGAGVVVLTNVGLEHTRWLGPTIRDIAREKLAVAGPGATLVTGSLHPDAEEEARAVGVPIVRPLDEEGGAVGVPIVRPLDEEARAVGVPIVRPLGEEARAVGAGALPAGYQRTNFLVAATAARVHLGRLDPRLAAEVGARVQVPGRLQQVAESPRTIYDGAHNPSGMEALAAALPSERPLIAVVSILDDKDAAGMLRALLPHAAGAVFTRARHPRALPPATLASLAAQLGGPPSEIVADPRAAVARARALAGPDGAVLATGSIYLVADLLDERGRRRASAL
jgi:dihydrofolate synthase / folylpolyglutamate synthase